VFANTGQRLIVPSPSSDGLQIDFFDADDSRAYFTYVLDRLESAVGPLDASALRYVEVDSLELEGSRLDAWTEDVLDVFRERYEYDAAPYLLLLKGAATDDDTGERFLHDWTRLISDLMIENHYRLGSTLLRERGLLLSAEAGGPGPPIWRSCPVDALGALGAVGLMRGEFWPKQRSMYNVKQIACAAHTYGQTIVDAESFTSWRHWRDGPYYLKLLADQAFVDGLNHVTFHTAPHSPSGAGLPGFAYHAGTHISPNLVWWPMAKPFIDYLSRCSFMLQQGRPVADVCFFQGAGAPAFHPLAVDYEPTVRPAGYDYDVVDVRVLLDSMTVRDGRLVLPHGASYALLALPERDSIDPAALAKIKDLVGDGATVVGPKPNRSSGLAGHPQCDDRVRTIADELWGTAASENAFEHRFGLGRVISGRPVVEVLERLSVTPDFAWDGGDDRTSLSFVHRSADDAEIYLIVNDNERWEHVEGLFRVHGRAPEIWDPSDGTSRPEHVFALEGRRTRVRLRLPPGGSTFVVFRNGSAQREPVALPVAAPVRPELPAPDVAHCDTPNGPAWLTDGRSDPASEFIVFDLGSARDLGHVDIWNFQDQTRGLLKRGIREMDVSVSANGSHFRAIGRVELRRVPDIGERGYQQTVPISAGRVRFVRFDVVSNHGDDWLGRTNYVGLNRVVFHDSTGTRIDPVRVEAVSSGVAHDPATDDDHPPALPTFELVTDAESDTVAHVWARTGDAALGTGRWARTLQSAGAPPAAFEIAGPWRVRFQAGRGAPAESVFPALVSWSEHDDAAIRYYSGIAEYARTFAPPDALLARDVAVVLDLGRVAGAARVTLNGRDLGVLWKPPYAVRVTGLLRPGANELRIEVANTWHNRLVGDATLKPAQRITSTNVRRPFTLDTPLVESGLLGPVRLHAARVVHLE
ncbi:MAG: glycosyl hydrolase, partial [Planctomycetota bacterium]